VFGRFRLVAQGRAQVADLLEEFTRNGWVLILVDGGAEVFTSVEEMIRDLRAWYDTQRRRRISARTREAIERKRAAGGRVGGPRRCPDAVLDRVLQLRDAGARQAEIAEEMNKAGLPTPGGGTHWWPSHVSRLLKTQDAQTRRGQGESYGRVASRPGGQRDQPCPAGGEHGAHR
jgi:DNA invertase Pin-like site-specific DNA recombinase